MAKYGNDSCSCGASHKHESFSWVELADRIKSISPVSWKHVNFYGEYNFRDPGEIVDLNQMVSRLAALEWDSAGPKQPN